jgi:hypothetical protein
MFCIPRYILDGRKERNIELSRLTSIPMPHRNAMATLRAKKATSLPSAMVPKALRNLARLNNIECLKSGLKTNSKGEFVLTRRMMKPGWLNEALVKDGVIDKGKKSQRQRCFEDYNAQMTFIAGMKAVMGDDYDPRHIERPFAKNGKWKSTNKYKNEDNPKGKS